MKKIDRTRCYGCNKKMEPGTGYCHHDAKHLVDSDVTMCWRCLLMHAEKHYGDCPVAKSIRSNHQFEIHNDPELKQRGQAELF